MVGTWRSRNRPCITSRTIALVEAGAVQVGRLLGLQQLGGDRRGAASTVAEAQAEAQHLGEGSRGRSRRPGMRAASGAVGRASNQRSP
jgi:hypothetical protein